MSKRTEDNKPNITWWTVLTNKHAFFGLLIMMIGSFDESFFQSFIAIELTSKGMREADVGYVIGS